MEVSFNTVCDFSEETNDYELAKISYNPKIHTMKWAVENNYLSCVKFMVKFNLGYTKTDEKLFTECHVRKSDGLLEIACKNGNFEMVDYLYNLGKDFFEDSKMFSIKSGNLDIVKFIKENNDCGNKFNSYHLEYAKKLHRSDIVNYLVTIV